MASKRRQRRHECERKERFTDQLKANRAAWRARKRTGDHIRSYKCRHGNHWHIGHASAGQRPERVLEIARVIQCLEKTN